MKKVIAFDLWNTLIYKSGRHITDIISQHFQLPSNEVHEWIRISSVTGPNHDRYSVYQNLCLANSMKFTNRDKQFIDTLFTSYVDECKWVDGAHDLLHSLKIRGYKLALISNTTDLSHQIIRAMGLAEYLDAVILSCDVGYLKPDPRIFKKMLGQLMVEPADVLFVGDKISTDVLGAKVMGIDVVLFNRLHYTTKGRPGSNIGNEFKPRVSLKGVIYELSNIINIIENEIN